MELHKVNGTEHNSARTWIRAETNKVRTSRTFICRNGQHFERLREIAKPSSNDKLVFTVDGESELSKRTLLYHWRKMIE